MQSRRFNNRVAQSRIARAKAIARARKGLSGKIRGRGAYWGQFLGGLAGRAIGSRFGLGDQGASVGARLGDIGSDYVEKRFMGRGAYNVLVNPKGNMRPMKSVPGETGDIVISHKEFLADITPVSGLFQTVYSTPINPGLTSFGSWISQIAQYYEEYEMIQLVFEFRSMITGGNSNASGTVIMATQYNPGSALFTVKQNMENYDYANSGKVERNLIHGVECDPKKRAGTTSEYVRTGAVPTGQDIKTYDLGIFQMATSGCQANLNIGELWVHYKIKFSKSKVVLSGANPTINSLSGYISNTSTGSLHSPMGKSAGTYSFLSTASNFAGTAGSKSVDSTSGALLFVQEAAGWKIQFPAWVNDGMFLLSYYFTKTAATDPGLFSVSPSNCICVISQSFHSAAAQTEKVDVYIRVQSPTGTVAALYITCPTNVNVSGVQIGLNQLNYLMADIALPYA